ncbi:putative protein kinase RLK-Pelle-PERK-1 family [Helianthus annuus]|uniref:non-specific serine/threonine protein kinase n=1 Tax=Helianthus annuus TaxID=4232 RepID=A0A251TNE0_HELAN|nr:putative protein kinase RLK-Pelle-PERK-1 family [Helianthus annuus]KAJ0431116.1 putative protein kinase RLK-Pelle-PERK-1 family [Helianthus annuus]KAJ0436242.1 putative protein kinase RLK-Pelle-PERK-1 family [Helianthus annuus]KAJ0449564.1 putative protein kinase RLK-Pelle-PERK-1 family [Helianthus annuus]KAJ0638249.1 putative protein kinase RLK-Pelle-PERK-1 family [Helianthus annuus]
MFYYVFGIIHADLKPTNILIDENYKPMLADFGFSRRNTDAGFVRTPRLMGTHEYTTPKYLLSGKLAEDANIFAYEVILYELLSGKKVNRLLMIHLEARTLLILSLDLIYIFPCYN